ncbi:MAG: M48 family peptidase [Anaerolineales bacterium]|nr:MAG: M48 family peptidase [Anaerolineales bacterium]
MKVTPDGVVVLLPCGLNADSPQVRTFVQAGLQKLQTSKVSETSEVSSEDLKALVADWSERIGVAVRRVQVRGMRRKWASCSSRGTLTLSADLLRLPHDLVEYVVCHELVHLRVPEHGKGWRALMGAYLPDWRERERRLAGWVVDRQRERKFGDLGGVGVRDGGE